MRRCWPALLVCLLIPAACAWSADDALPASKSPTDGDLAALTQLLNLAWSGDPQAPEAVREWYDSQRNRISNKSRWHYAYGIASLKMKRYPAATQAFRAAIKESSSFSLAAWKGLIWSQLNHKRYDNGLDDVTSFAEIVASKKFPGTAEEREAAAVWIGQTMGALDKIVTAPKTRQHLTETDAWLKKVWPADLQDAEQSGRDYTDMLLAELTDDLKQATEAAKAREEDQKKDQHQKLTDKAAAAEKQRDELKKNAEEFQKQSKERLEQIDKQLSRLERDYNYMQTRAQSVLQSMLLVENQMNFYQQSQGNQKQGQTPTVTTNMQQFGMMYNAYQQQYAMTLAQGVMVGQRAMETLQIRDQLVRQMQQTSGELNEQDDNLSKWQQRLSANAENLQKQKVKGKSATVREKRAKAKTLSTYLEFDPEWERINLSERPDSE